MTVVVHVGLPSVLYAIASVCLGRFSAGNGFGCLGVRKSFGTLSLTAGVHVGLPSVFIAVASVLLGRHSAGSRYSNLGLGFGLCLISELSLLLSIAFSFHGVLILLPITV